MSISPDEPDIIEELENEIEATMDDTVEFDPFEDDDEDEPDVDRKLS